MPSSGYREYHTPCIQRKTICTQEMSCHICIDLLKSKKYILHVYIAGYKESVDLPQNNEGFLNTLPSNVKYNTSLTQPHHDSSCLVLKVVLVPLYPKCFMATALLTACTHIDRSGEVVESIITSLGPVVISKANCPKECWFSFFTKKSSWCL